jgi:NDP-sugar pyrophosphorylase family protein
MLFVKGKPFLQHLLTKYYNEGFRDFIVSIHYLASKIVSYPFKLPKDAKLRFVHDPLWAQNKDDAMEFLVKNHVDYYGAWFINADTWIKQELPAVGNYSHAVLTYKDVDAGAQYISSRVNTQIKVEGLTEPFIDMGTPKGLEEMRDAID